MTSHPEPKVEVILRRQDPPHPLRSRERAVFLPHCLRCLFRFCLFLTGILTVWDAQTVPHRGAPRGMLVRPPSRALNHVHAVSHAIRPEPPQETCFDARDIQTASHPPPRVTSMLRALHVHTTRALRTTASHPPPHVTRRVTCALCAYSVRDRGAAWCREAAFAHASRWYTVAPACAQSAATGYVARARCQTACFLRRGVRYASVTC